jgi:hypothetical protein
MTDMIKYSIDDFESIKKCGFDYIMSNDIVTKIASLSLEVGSPNYVKTPIFKKNDKHDTPFIKKKKYKSNEALTEDDWESLRTFHTTQIEEKHGLEKELDTIRCNLNKLSDKNYNIILKEIVTIINTFMDELTPEYKGKVSLLIFEIASSNRFFSKIYATMYKELTDYYDWLLPIFQDKKQNFRDLFTTIEFVDSDEDYNRFCELNNENERRKAYSSFYVSLFQLGMIEYDFLKSTLIYLVDKVFHLINEEGNKNHVDELIENICILVQKDMMDNESRIYEVIDLLSQSKVKDFKSLTSKTIFKCMDILEL